MHSDPDKIERIARELHAHSWSSFLKWDSHDMSEGSREEWRAKARSGKMTKNETRDGYVPEGMEVVPYIPQGVSPMEFKSRNEARPKESLVFMPHIKVKEKDNIDNINKINEILTVDSPVKRKRGRPPGSKNKK